MKQLYILAIAVALSSGFGDARAADKHRLQLFCEPWSVKYLRCSAHATNRSVEYGVTVTATQDTKLKLEEWRTPCAWPGGQPDKSLNPTLNQHNGFSYTHTNSLSAWLWHNNCVEIFLSECKVNDVEVSCREALTVKSIY